MLSKRDRKFGLIGMYVAAFFAIFVIFGIAHASHAFAATAASSESQGWHPATSYVTTAYYLNVRSEASNQSRIIDVVEKGTVLSVTGQSGKWLKLDSGGYVHGSYAKRIEAPAPAPEPAPTPASSPQPQVSAGRPVAASFALFSAATEDPPALRKPDAKVKTASGLTEARIKELFDGTALAGQGLEKAVLEVEADYGVNAFFTIAVMKLESGNGSSKVARTRNNLFGLNSSNGTGYLRFKTKEDSVRKFGQLISQNYIGKGYTTIEKIARKYCPANSKWPSLIKSVINSDYKNTV